MKAQITLRIAREPDAPTLAAAEREIARTPGRFVSRPDELLDARFAEKIRALAASPRGRYLVAEEAGRIVGHSFLDPLHLRAIEHVAHLSMCVHEGNARRGIGEALLSELIAWARTSPLEKIELHVRESNLGAIALYRKLGFAEEGRWKRRIRLNPDRDGEPGRYLDDVLMGLWLRP